MLPRAPLPPPLSQVYRTTYMFSATMPPAVERIARKYLRRPVVVQIGSTTRATENVTQHIKMLSGKNTDPEKLRLLEDALRSVRVQPLSLLLPPRLPSALLAPPFCNRPICS